MPGGHVLLARTQPIQQQPQQSGAQCLRRRQQCLAGHGGTRLRQVSRRQLVQIGALTPQDVRRPRNMRRRGGIDALQLRPDLQPQPVPGVGQITVGLVGDVGQPIFRDIPLNVPARRVQQRPHDVAPHRRDASQSLRPGAAQQLQKHRLRQIVPVVGGGDLLRADGCRRPLEKVVPRPVSSTVRSHTSHRPYTSALSV